MWKVKFLTCHAARNATGTAAAAVAGGGRPTVGDRVHILEGPGSGGTAVITRDDHDSQPYRLEGHGDYWYRESHVRRLGTASAASPAALYVVSGCGMEEFNGEYIADGTADGVPRYRKAGEWARQTMNRSSGSWYMCRDHSGNWYKAAGQSRDTPPRTGWAVGSRGRGSAPTVTPVAGIQGGAEDADTVAAAAAGSAAMAQPWPATAAAAARLKKMSHAPSLKNFVCI